MKYKRINNPYNNKCFVVACIQILGTSNTLEEIISKDVSIEGNDLFSVLKMYFVGENDSLLNLLVESFCYEYIASDFFSYIDFMSYYCIPLIHQRYGEEVMWKVLNNICFKEFFIDRCRYSYSNKLKQLLRENYVEESITRYKHFIRLINLRPINTNNKVYKIETINGHCNFVLIF